MYTHVDNQLELPPNVEQVVYYTPRYGIHTATLCDGTKVLFKDLRLWKFKMPAKICRTYKSEELR
ncbi:MAG: hypothetical protein EOP45_18780 [Sphingobacteriaceae bacterium]|nr:MAG: hypothetical protein EOP45_18780 [Sphingobacteriaceae bacterium]